jgi:hypothetical protein
VSRETFILYGHVEDDRHLIVFDGLKKVDGSSILDGFHGLSLSDFRATFGGCVATSRPGASHLTSGLYDAAIEFDLV